VAQHPSAEKRNRQNNKRRTRNQALRSRMRTAMKAARAALASKAPNKADLVKEAIGDIHRAATKKVVRKGTASRYVSRIMRAQAQAK
jgi:small subunit ribosomal protein S20